MYFWRLNLSMKISFTKKKTKITREKKVAGHLDWQAFIICSRIVNFNIGHNGRLRDIHYSH